MAVKLNEEQLLEKLESAMNKIDTESKMPKIGIYGLSIELMEDFAKKVFREDYYNSCCVFIDDSTSIEKQLQDIDVLWSFANINSAIPCHTIDNISENSILSLIEWTESVLPHKNKTAFVKHQKIHINLKEKYVNKAIAQHSAGAFAVGFNPFDIGIGDSVILVTSEIALMGRILNIYDLENVQQVIKTIGFSTIIGNLLTTAGRGVATGLLKLATKALGPLGWVAGGSVYGASATAVTVAFGKSISKVVKAICRAEISNNLEQIKFISEHFSEAVNGTAVDCLEKGLVSIEDYEKSGFDKADLSFEELKSNIEKGNQLFQDFLDKNVAADNLFKELTSEDKKKNSDMWNAINKL
ncbi:hypothetical protein SAMN04487775_10779 [Treponema bryantii]|uniref:DUF697 domain-containing protein n=1 Tax=Treponema bryantii TaxID=163 RepID=A0A1I3LN38_9SPIR|nr:hypothetical protein [Treponema bryantii]SFI85905.1 hypothetical protein SAMN04487775_10779 [Treponema bryantii]